jgi:hypothetical protein
MIRVCEDGIFELYFEGKYYGCVKVENLIPHQPGRGNFHINIIRFSHHILNRMKRDETSLMNHIRDAGYNELISFVDITTVKHGNIKLWSRFIKLFEFEEPKLFTRKIL